MKTLILAFALFLVTSKSNAQLNPQTSIPFSSIELKKANTSTPSLKYGATKNDVLAIFGAPGNILVMPWDDFDKDINGYTYDNNFIYIDEGSQSLWGFRITDSNFYILYKNHVIKVGDDISSLSSLFSTSYQNKYSDTIAVSITGYDYVLAFLFNPTTNKITSIWTAYV